MILSEQEVSVLVLMKQMVQGAEHFTPFGLDVTAGHLALAESEPGVVLSVDGSRHNEYCVKEVAFPILLAPGDQVNVYTQEIFNLPNNVRARCYSTATMNICGVAMSGDVVLHPGWKGRLLLPIRNNNKYHPIEILPGSKLGHVQFSTVPNSGRSYNGSYQYAGVEDDRATEF